MFVIDAYRTYPSAVKSRLRVTGTVVGKRGKVLPERENGDAEDQQLINSTISAN